MKSAAKPISKTAFVKSLPRTMPAKEVVSKAKAKGLVISEKYVYVIRSSANRGAGKKGVKIGRGRGARAGLSTATAAAHGNGSSAGHFVDLVLEIGLSRAQALLDKMRATVSNLPI